jgi:hypothetical protein
VNAISYVLKEGKNGDEYTISDLVKRTDMHYVTMNDYLNIIEYVQNNIPKISKINTKGHAKIVIMEEIEMPSSSEKEALLLNLFDKGAFTKNTAADVKTLNKKPLKDAEEQDLVRKEGAKYYLTADGIISAARTAGMREERIMHSRIANGKDITD